jgi:hypothetical protein
MRPPICLICQKKNFDLNKGGLVYFKKSKEDLEFDKRVEKTHIVAHPPYAEWFCEEHFPKANELSNLTKNEAVKKLKQLFPEK